MKPEFMRLRRTLAGTVAALLIAAGLVVLSPALSASAHHNTINVSASCNNYVWTITWTITNSETDKWERITFSTDQSIIANDVIIDEGSTYTKTETVSGPLTKTLRVSAIWQNNVTNTSSKSIYPNDFSGTCERPDTPQISITGSTCATPSASSGTVNFSLSGVTKAYTVTLLAGGTAKATVQSSGGVGSFSGVSPGTYTVKATQGYAAATSGTITVDTCAPAVPDVDLVAQPCVTGGALGAVTATLSNLKLGTLYTIVLLDSADFALETLALTATNATYTKSFAGHGPGQYSVAIYDTSGGLLTESADATILACADDFTLTVELKPCATLQTGTDREINVTADGLTASTPYTVRLVTTATPAVEIASTAIPSGSAVSFTHTFTGVPSPGDYKVEVLGGPVTLVSNTVTAADCDLDTLAPPSIELIADQCDGVSPPPSALSARMIDLDATRTYFVRIVDGSGATVTGGEDQTVTGATTATVKFPDVTAPGTYTAQLLIDPGKQLAATSPSSVGLNVCLPTLAMTGPGVLVPLGSVAALLLTLGGAVVLGRLRRRMAL